MCQHVTYMVKLNILVLQGSAREWRTNHRHHFNETITANTFYFRFTNTLILGVSLILMIFILQNAIGLFSCSSKTNDVFVANISFKQCFKLKTSSVCSVRVSDMCFFQYIWLKSYVPGTINCSGFFRIEILNKFPLPMHWNNQIIAVNAVKRMCTLGHLKS